MLRNVVKFIFNYISKYIMISIGVRKILQNFILLFFIFLKNWVNYFAK